LNTSVMDALIRSRSLNPASLQGLIVAVAAVAPDRLLTVADRSDLDSDLRADLIRAARPYDLVPMLRRWPADLGLVEVAEAGHGAEPSLVVYCAAQGWAARAREMAARMRPDDVGSVPSLWARELGSPIPDDMRVALLDPLMVTRKRPTGIADMTDRERDKYLEQLQAETERRERAAWGLLAPVPHLWADLAREGSHADAIRSVLLEYPDEITDDVLLACLPRVTLEHRRPSQGKGELDGEVRMAIAARYARRRPRLRVIAADELRQIAQDAVDDGWTPRHDLLGPDWRSIADLAVLTEDPALLSAAARAAAETMQAEAPPASYYVDVPRKRARRIDAILAVVANPATPRADLIALVSMLDEQTVIRIEVQADEELAAACRARIADLQREAAARQSRYAAVPSDDELAGSTDPEAALRHHLRYLRGTAGQRDVTAEGLLRSRYTTPDMLEIIPARHVLAYADRADQVAERIIEVCGDRISRWQAFIAVAEAKPTPAMTFKAWLAQLADAS
jgi:hypothetical protein